MEEKKDKSENTISFGENATPPNEKFVQLQAMRLDIIDRGPYDPKAAAELSEKLRALNIAKKEKEMGTSLGFKSI